MITRAEWSRLTPRIGRSRALSRPWSHFDPVVRVLLSVVKHGWDEFIDRSPQRRRSSVTISVSAPRASSAEVKNRRPARTSRRAET
jgi:hypothetical protein